MIRPVRPAMRVSAQLPVCRPQQSASMPRIGSPAVPRVRGSWAVAAWFVLAVGILTAVYATNPTNTRGLAAYVTISLSVGAAIWWGTCRYRPTIRTGWYLLAAAPPLGSVGMVLR